MSTASQEFIPIKEVRDGVVVLQNGGLRSIIMVSSLNFDLKSEEEQNALLAQFQQLLNSIEFSVQFFVQSREMDIEPYLQTLAERQKQIPEELLQVQVREYIEFIKWFTDQVNIMKKNFFVVVPYDVPAATSNKGILGFLSKIGGSSSDALTRFEESRIQLEQRVSIVRQGLESMGVRGVQLGTQEVVDVYYQIFNPGEKRREIKLDNA